VSVAIILEALCDAQANRVSIQREDEVKAGDFVTEITKYV
jgi:hypothetical protein